MGNMEVIVTDEDRQLLQNCLVEVGGNGGHALGARARADEGVLAVALEDGIQAVEGGQPQVTMVLPQEAGKQGDCLILTDTQKSGSNKHTYNQVNKQAYKQSGSQKHKQEVNKHTNNNK